MNNTYAGKVALVIGGGRGMGRDIAKAFAAEGAHVVVSARTEAYGKETIKQIDALGGAATLCGGDIGVRRDVTAMIDTAAAVTGTIDVLVVTAAEAPTEPLCDMADDTYDTMVQSNINGIYWIAKDAAPHLSKAADWGRLIYISSGSANRTFVPGLVAYASSKAYMNAFARGLAVELGPRRITVNVVEPGLIASDRMKEHLSEDAYTAIARQFPVPRVGQHADVTGAVLYLASPQGSYVTGTSILVDGGASMASLAGVVERS
jgi:3-oxoacyl-[acyl-carrier protein] reductase